jgi:membrane protein required for colicin V production
MTWFDIAVLIVLGLSMLVGVMRGFVKEVMAIAAWVIALVLARQFGPTVANWFPAALQPAGLRLAVGFACTTFGALMLLWLVTYFAMQIIRAKGLSLADRTIGAIFGLVRGVLIVLVGVLVAGLTSLPKEHGWRNAWLSSPFEALAVSVKAWLPESIRTRIQYD